MSKKKTTYRSTVKKDEHFIVFFQANMNHTLMQWLAKNKMVIVERWGGTLDYLFVFQQGKLELRHHSAYES